MNQERPPEHIIEAVSRTLSYFENPTEWTGHTLYVDLHLQPNRPVPAEVVYQVIEIIKEKSDE